MTNRLPTVLVFLFCYALTSSAVVLFPDEDFESFMQDTQSDADAGSCMLQVQSQHLSAVIDEAGAFHNQSESSIRQAWATLQKWSPAISQFARRHDTATQHEHQPSWSWARARGTHVQKPDGLSSDAASWAATISVSAIAVVGFIRIVHRSIQDAFKIMPEASVLMFLCLLGAFCWGFETEIRLSGDHLMVSNWTLVSGCIAQTILTFTPLLLLVPCGTMAGDVFKSKYGIELHNKVKEWANQMTDWISLFHLIVLSLQIASTMSVYVIAKVTQSRLQAGIHAVESVGKVAKTKISPEDVPTEEFVQPVMVTLLYVLLSWCSLAVIYERGTKRSFLNDFPNRVFQEAFPSLFRHESNHGKEISDDNMNDAQDILESFSEGEMTSGGIHRLVSKMTAENRALKKDIEKVHGTLEKVKNDVKRLENDFSREADKIVDSILSVEREIKATGKLGFWIHFCVYHVYFCAAVGNSFFVAVCVAQVIFLKGHFILPGVYLTCAFPLIYLYFGIRFMCSCSGAFDAEVVAQEPGTQEPGAQKPAAQALISAPA